MNKLLSSINKAIAIFFIGISTMSAAHANVVLSGTRVIYPETEKEVTLKVNNKGKNSGSHPELDRYRKCKCVTRQHFISIFINPTDEQN